MHNDIDFSHALLSPDSASKYLLPALPPGVSYTVILDLLDASVSGPGSGPGSDMLMEATTELLEQQHADSAYASDDDDLALSLDQAVADAIAEAREPEAREAEVLHNNQRLTQQAGDIKQLRCALVQAIGADELKRLEEAPSLATREAMQKASVPSCFLEEQAGPCESEIACESFVPEPICVPTYDEHIDAHGSVEGYLNLQQQAIFRHAAILDAYVSLAFHANLYHETFGHAMVGMSGKQTHGHTKQMGSCKQFTPPPGVQESAGCQRSAARPAMTSRTMGKVNKRRLVRPGLSEHAKQLLFGQPSSGHSNESTISHHIHRKGH
jgi:hypothetical protein